MTDLDDAIFRAERYDELTPGAGTPRRPMLRHVRRLPRLTPTQIADDAIGLFLEYRDMHGYPEGRARAAALLEIVEAADVSDQLVE